MFGRLMPTEGKFFEFFIQHGELCVKGSKELVSLMTNFDDLEHRVHAIETIEKQADKVTHSALELLHKTFITPLDREDIHHLITRMDDILDLMEDVAQTISLYDIKAITPEAKRLAELCQACCEKVLASVSLLHNMDNAREMLAPPIKIAVIEEKARDAEDTLGLRGILHRLQFPPPLARREFRPAGPIGDRKSTRLNSSH